VLFGRHREQIMRRSVVIALLAVPIIIQVYFNASVAYWVNRVSSLSGASQDRPR